MEGKCKECISFKKDNRTEAKKRWTPYVCENKDSVFHLHFIHEDSTCFCFKKK